MSMDSVFDADWKDEVKNIISVYNSLSEEVADVLLYIELEMHNVVKFMCSET